MHGAAFGVLGLEDASYAAIDVAPEALGEFVESGARARGLDGFNVTVPHKRAILPMLDRVAEDAAAVGAVNTVRFCPALGGWEGFNTDVPGFGRALDRFVSSLPAAPARVAVLGGGGAARAVVAALCEREDIGPVAWVSRDPSALAASLPPRVRSGGAAVSPVGWQTWEGPEAGTLLVQTTPVGLPGGPRDFPRDLGPAALSTCAGVFDLLVPASDASLVAAAREAGIPACDGASMLVWQGHLALDLWLTGEGLSVLTPEVHAAMRRAVEPPENSP